MLYQPMEYIIDPLSDDEVFMYITDDIVPNIQPYYLISNYGRVYSTRSGRFMKPTLNADGYLVFTARTIDNNGLTLYIHRIEMLVFKYEPGCENLVIDHIDCNKTNNYLVNLEWVTLGENTRRAANNNLLLTGEDAPWTKVCNNKVHKICQLYINDIGICEIARIVDCGIDSVFRIVHGISRTDISSQYDIEKRYRGTLTNDQIHNICCIYSKNKNLPYSESKKDIERLLNIRINRNIDSILRALYRHDIYCFYNISSMYDY